MSCNSVTSNHMTGCLNELTNINNYDRIEHIQIVNGSTLLITATGRLGVAFSHVFVAPGYPLI